MRKFRFSLDGLLKVSRLKEKQAERALQEGKRRLWKAEEDLRQAETAAKEAMTALRKCLKQKAEGKEAKERTGFLGWRREELLFVAVRHLDEEKRRWRLAKQQVAAAQAEVAKRLHEYRECRRQRELLEELREKAFRQWLAEFLREEQRTADERVLRDYALTKENGA